MEPDVAKRILQRLAPGEAEQILRDFILTEEDRNEFRKREAKLLYKIFSNTSESDYHHG